MTTQVLFGEVQLEEYLSGPISHTESLNREKNLKEQIRERKRYGILSSEKASLEKLYNLKAQTAVEHIYQQLNPDFLSMSNEITYEGVKVNVPKFSIYPVFADNKMVVRMTTDKRGDNNFRYCSWIEVENYGIPDALKEPMKKAIRINPKSEFALFLREHYTSTFNFNSHLNGFIPVETKRKIKKAKREFGKEGLYFIAETKPESWSVREFTKDPLVVGVLRDKCYLVDKFNTTSLEDYVAREFSS